MRAAFTGCAADACHVAQRIPQGGVFCSAMTCWPTMFSLRRVTNRFGVFGDGARQRGDRRGDGDALGHAVHLEQHRVRTGETPVDSGILQHLIQCLLRCHDARYAGGGKLTNPLIGHGDFQIGELAEELGSVPEQAGWNVEAPRG